MSSTPTQRQKSEQATAGQASRYKSIVPRDAAAMVHALQACGWSPREVKNAFGLRYSLSAVYDAINAEDAEE